MAGFLFYFESIPSPFVSIPLNHTYRLNPYWIDACSMAVLRRFYYHRRESVFGEHHDHLGRR